MLRQPSSRGVTEVVVGLNFHPRPWVPDNLRESTNVIVKCLLSRSAEYPALVVDSAVPIDPLPGGLAGERNNSKAKRNFREALLEALQNRLEDDVRPIQHSVVDWEGVMLLDQSKGVTDAS